MTNSDRTSYDFNEFYTASSNETIIEDLSENNLFNDVNDEYGYLSEEVWNLEKDGEKGILRTKYKTWDNYYNSNKELLQKQIRMVDLILYLVDNEGDDKGASAHIGRLKMIF